MLWVSSFLVDSSDVVVVFLIPFFPASRWSAKTGRVLHPDECPGCRKAIVPLVVVICAVPLVVAIWTVAATIVRLMRGIFFVWQRMASSERHAR